jgi:hypothetical protein
MRLSGRRGNRNHILNSKTLDVVRPSGKQGSALLQGVRPSICALYAADNMGQNALAHFSGKGGFISSPVPEADGVDGCAGRPAGGMR